MHFFFFSSRRRHTRLQGDWSSDVCSSDLIQKAKLKPETSSRPPREHRFPDRKSTRLNSSHLVISYAVFCLKKKHERQEGRHRSTPAPPRDRRGDTRTAA